MARKSTMSSIDDVIPRINGIRCGSKGTSCPDQLCRALEQLKQAPLTEELGIKSL